MKYIRIISLCFILPTILNLPVKSQVSMFSRIKNLPLKHSCPVDEACQVPAKAPSGKTGELWLAFSDSEENVTYADPHARNELGKLSFMQPLLVLRIRNGYCKVVAYDLEILGENGVVGGMLFANKKSFRLKNRKKVKYLGWVSQDRLIHSRKAQVCGHNFVQQKFMTAISHPRMVTNRKAFLAQDSILLAHAPGFRKKAKDKAPLHSWMYIYKKNDQPSQYLIGSEPFIDPDSMQGVFGWVADSMVLPIGQNMVLLPASNGDSVLGNNNSRYPVRFADGSGNPALPDSVLPDLRKLSRYDSAGWALPVNFPLGPELNMGGQEIRTFFPMELIDLADSRIYNCVGQPFAFGEFQKLKKQLKRVNIVLVFEDGREGKESLRRMIVSFQDLFTHTQKESLEGFSFNYSAVGYIGRWPSESLPWTNSFSQWLEFIQSRAEDKSVEFFTLEHVMLRGLQEAASLLKGHEREHNIVIAVGSKINAETFPKLFDLVIPELASVSANLIFLQPERGKSVNYSDMVLQSKRILNEVGSRARKYREQIIVDNQLVKNKNVFRTDDRCGNGYLYDFPSRSMQKGGLFFPAANSSLCPNILEWVMDTILRQVRLDNDLILRGMQEKFVMLGRLKQKVNPQLGKALDDQGIFGLPDSVANTYNDRFYVEAKASFYPDRNSFKPGFMLSGNEFDNLIRDLRKVVIDPKLNRNGDSEIDYKDRRRWCRELKHIYRDRNRFYGKKTSAGKATLAEVIYMKTGYPVNRPFFQELQIRNIGSRTKVEQEELLPEIGFFHQDILKLLEFPSTNPAANAVYAGKSFFLLPIEILP
jgi:hypothetical protein